MASEKEIALPMKLADLYYIFSTVAASDLPRNTSNDYTGCDLPSSVCFYPISSNKIYTRVVGEIRSNYPSQHGIMVVMWDMVKNEWSDFMVSLQMPANSSDWHSFDYIIPSLTNISEIRFYTTVDVTIDLRNGKLYYLEGDGAVTLEKCITLRDDTWSCDPYTSGSCNCGDEGPQQNTFDWQQKMMCYSKITGDIEGVRHAMVFFFDWGDGLYPVSYHEWDPTPHTSYACFWAWPNIGGVYGNGVGVVGIYIDGILIGQSNPFTITGAPQGAIIDWYRKDPRIGPFDTGQQNAYVISGELTNTGSSGFYYTKLVQNPGTPQENLLAVNGNDLDAGQGIGFARAVNMPTVAGIYILGLKVWGDGQNEPSWGSANTQIWNIYVGVIPPCEEYWFQLECEQNNCYWYGGSCHESPLICENILTQTECEGYDCYWYDDSCHSSPQPPPLPIAIIDTPHDGDTVTSPVHFEGHGEPVQNFWYLWWKINGEWTWVTQDAPSSSFDYELSPGYHDIEFWVVASGGVSSEHVFIGIEVTALPEICSWIDSEGGHSGLSIADVFVIIDSYLYDAPPSGYTFVPTLQNVFGVIDYYLGFDGDAATGCDFFP